MLTAALRKNKKRVDQWILEKAMKPEDVERIKRQVPNCTEVVKKYMNGDRKEEGENK